MSLKSGYTVNIKSKKAKQKGTKNQTPFDFDTICNITKEPQELQRFNCTCGFIDKSAVILMSSTAAVKS